RAGDHGPAPFSRCPAQTDQGRRPSHVGTARDRCDFADGLRSIGACPLILLLAATLASSAAPPARRCPELITPEAMICRAIEAQANGNAEAAAQSFEEAANASTDKD